jgi:hypothetical protein
MFCRNFAKNWPKNIPKSLRYKKGQKMTKSSIAGKLFQKKARWQTP